MTLVMPGDRLQARGINLDGEGDHWSMTSSGLVVPSTAGIPARPMVEQRPVCVDLFCGAGGFSLGMEAAGFHVAVAAEWDMDAAATYLTNLGGPDALVVPLDDMTIKKRKGLAWVPGDYTAGVPIPCADIYPAAGSGWISGQAATDPCLVFYLGDVTNLTGRMILDALARDDVDVVVGGPPCQGFSMASGRAAAELRYDARNLLVFEFARLCLETNAKAFVMENVPRLLTMLTAEGVPVVDALARVMADGGFSTYDAIRRSLLANADAGAAMRRTGKNPDVDELDDDDLDDQLTLFGGAA